jgi:hypothetical protein
MALSSRLRGIEKIDYKIVSNGIFYFEFIRLNHI